MRYRLFYRTGVVLAAFIFSLLFIQAVPAYATSHGSVTITYSEIEKPSPLPELKSVQMTATETLEGVPNVGYDALIAEAERYLGTPYVWGGKSPKPGFDCSGYVSYVYKKAGVYNFNGSNAQGIYNQCTKIKKEKDAKPGDLVFFKNTFLTDDGRSITHVGIYIGNGKMLHSPGTGKSVCSSSFHTKYWQNHSPVFGRISG